MHPGLKALELYPAALNAVEVAMFHFRGSIKRLCHSVSSLFFLFKWKQKDEWSLVHGTLPPSGPEKEDQWEPDREQDSDELWLSLHLSISVSDRTQTDVVGWGGVGGSGVFGWLDATRGRRHAVRAQRRVPHLEEGAGAFWGRRGSVRRTVTHGEDVIVAGDVGATGNVIGALGEAGGHSVGSLQDAHSRLWGHFRKEEGNSRTEMVRNIGGGEHTHTHKHTDLQKRPDSVPLI